MLLNPVEHVPPQKTQCCFSDKETSLEAGHLARLSVLSLPQSYTSMLLQYFARSQKPGLVLLKAVLPLLNPCSESSGSRILPSCWDLVPSGLPSAARAPIPFL